MQRIHWYHIVLSLIAAALVVALPFLNFEDRALSYRAEKPAGIISVLQIDEFEGGSGSRCEWLKKRAVEFEAKNKGVFVEVTTGTVTQLEELIARDSLPDIVSFSGGLGELLYPSLMPYTGGQYARDEVAESGRAGSAAFAVPWCMGGYVLAGYEDYLTKAGMAEKSLLECALSSAVTASSQGESVQLTSLSFGFSAYTNPLYALKQAATPQRGENAFKLDYAHTQFYAYDAFVGGYASTLLLGTQRDVIRLEGKLEAGRIRPLRFQPVPGWTDIVQYMGITETEDKAKYRYAVKYLEYLQSEEVQRKLSSIGMVNVLGETFYTSGGMQELEAALSGRLSVQNVFTSGAEIQRRRAEAESVGR